MKVSKSLLNIGSGVAGLVVVILIAIAANVILSNFSLRMDLTDEKLYTLSEGTGNILKRLEQPVILKFFFNESDPQIPMPVKSFARRVQDLLVEYEVRADGNIVIENYDPKPDSDAEDWAQRYGVAGQGLGFMGPTLYIGLVAVMDDAEAVMPVLDPQSENLLEYNITRMITRVANPSKPVVGVLSSLPVLGSTPPPYAMPGQPTPQPQPAWVAFRELRKDYEVRNVETSVERIDDDIDTLIVVHPKNLSDKVLFAIDQFVLRGGSLLAFLDPLSLSELDTQPAPPQMRFAARSSNLPKLLDAWGVTYEDSKVVADLEATSRLRVGNGNEIQNSPVWLSLRRAHLNAEDILTSELESVMMPYAGSFRVAEAEGLEVVPLLSSSETSSLVEAMTAQYSADGVRRAFKSGYTRLVLAVRLHGKLRTAFPNGAPDSEDDASGEGDDEGAGDRDAKPQEAFLIASVDTSTVVLVGDSDMLFDRFCVRETGFFGFKAHQPMNDNLALLVNTVEQITGSTDLIGVRARGKTERPFEVVLELERKAQQRYLAEEVRLQQTLEDAQRRLAELQRQKDSSQKYILSAQQKAEIGNFQKQVLVTKRELKLVRRRLREDIERLGVKLKVINILLMPAFVAVAGVSFGAYRRKKQ